MSLDLSTLFILGSSYLLLLFGVAYITDRGWIPASIVQSPVVYVLALGVFASIWAYYTSIGNALESGDQSVTLTITDNESAPTVTLEVS